MWVRWLWADFETKVVKLVAGVRSRVTGLVNRLRSSGFKTSKWSALAVSAVAVRKTRDGNWPSQLRRIDWYFVGLIERR